MKALAVLSSNEHRGTCHWRLVEEQHFKNGRLDESHIFVTNHYEKPDELFVATKFLVFEAQAIANAYIMENLEEAIRSVQEEDEND
jgi:hypothetical protein